MAGPDSFMPIFIADYLGDTRHLSLAQHGAYLLLTFQYWRTGKPLPDDDVILARLCSATVTDWETVTETVRAFFKPATLNGKRVLTHKRIEQELDKARSNYEKRVAASARANKAKTDAANRLKTKAVTVTVTDTVTEPEADTDTVAETVSVTQLTTHNSEDKEEENISAIASPGAVAPLTEREIPKCLDRRKTKPNSLNGHRSDFQAFYDVFPSHIAPRAAEKAYVSALKRATSEIILAGAIRYRDDPKRNPEYTKRPATWLNADCWLDETGPTESTEITEAQALMARFEEANRRE